MACELAENCTMRNAVFIFDNYYSKFEIGKDNNIKIWSFDGLNGLDKIFNDDESPFLDGVVNSSYKALPRYLTFNMTIPNSKDRRYLNSFFAIGSLGVLYVAWNGTEQTLEYQVFNGTELTQDGICKDYNFILKLRSNGNPYWREAKSYKNTLAKSQTSGNSLLVTNTGDVEAGFIIDLKFKGNVTNPRVYLDEVNTINVLGDFVDGDILTISTEAGKLYVLKNTEDYISNIDIAKTYFFKIPRKIYGDTSKTKLYYTAETGSDKIAVNLELGVLRE